MYEGSGTRWTIVGADGTTIELNDNASGLYLEEISGFDSPSIRTNVEDLPESDGAVAGDFFFGQRPVTLRGRIHGTTASARNAAMVNLQRALRGLRDDVTVKSQSSGLPAMQVSARIVDLKFGGGYVKTFQVSMICADPLIYSQTENAETATGAATVPGAAFPWAFPVDFGGGIGATLIVSATNAGNFDAPCVIRVWGPITDPQVTNDSVDESIYVDNLVLVAGEYIDIDTGARTVVKSDGVSYYDRVRFPGSDWFRLQPGANTIQLWGSGSSGGTEIDVTWRDAWA